MPKHVEADDTTEPRIFIRVERTLKGKPIGITREISLETWTGARPGLPGRIAEVEIEAILREVMDAR